MPGPRSDPGPAHRPCVRQTDRVHARSAVVDLYGDHLRRRGWWAPVATVVALSGAVGVSPPAARTAISRLGAQGRLEARSVDGVRGYAASARARDRWQRAHDRIYASGPAPWDHRWHVVQVDPGGDRRRREQVTRTLTYLGYGRLGPGGWVSPRPSPELAASLDALAVEWVAVHGELSPGGGPAGDRALAARVWDLQALATAYDAFDARLPAVTGDGADVGLEPQGAYRTRTLLVHEWRRFLFQDPELPPAVLPPGWSGHASRRRFLEVARALAPAADRFVDAVLAGSARPTTGSVD